LEGIVKDAATLVVDACYRSLQKFSEFHGRSLAESGSIVEDMRVCAYVRPSPPARAQYPLA
jgi:hypothetical protein